MCNFKNKKVIRLYIYIYTYTYIHLGASLEKITDELKQIKKEIIDYISENILDQNDDSILAAMMSAFDLSSEEDYESWIEKISFLYDYYGIDYVHTLDEKW